MADNRLINLHTPTSDRPREEQAISVTDLVAKIAAGNLTDIRLVNLDAPSSDRPRERAALSVDALTALVTSKASGGTVIDPRLVMLGQPSSDRGRERQGLSLTALALLTGSGGPRLNLPIAPYAAFSTIQLANWNGPGAQDQDGNGIGFVAGLLDTSTQKKAAVWKDQSGNGFDAAQATDANRPLIGPRFKRRGIPTIHGFNQSGLGLDLPASLILTQNDLSYFVVMRSTQSFSSCGVVQFGAAAPMYATGFNANNQRFNDFGSTPNFATETPFDPRVISGVSGASLNRSWNNEVVKTIANATAQPLTGGKIGRYTPSNYSMTGDWLAVIVYNRALSDAEAQAVRNALYAAFNIVPIGTPLVVWDGNSLVNGAFNSNLSFADPAMELLTTRARAVRTAETGQAVSGMVTNYPARVAPLYSAANPRNAVIGMDPTNDLAANVSAADAYNSIKSYASSARTTGFKVIPSTCLPRTSSFSNGQTAAGFETARQAYNSLLRADAATIWTDGYCDLGAHTIIGAAGASDDTTLFIDKIHMTDLGNNYAAQVIAPVLQAALN